MARPLVVVIPDPHPLTTIFRAAAWERLTTEFEVVLLDASAPDSDLDAVLPEAFAVVGQPDLPAERLRRAGRLRALMNVEGNFYPNVDYPTAFAHGVRVLGCGPAYAQAVAELALGLALDLARGISREDRAFRAGRERYLAAGNADAVLLSGADVGLVGFGNLGRSLRPLLEPFGVTVRGYDPWLPEAVLVDAGVHPAALEQVLSQSMFVFVLATVTGDSEHLLGSRELAMLTDGARIVLVSRAAVVDYDALLSEVGSGRIHAAVDVWPDEPVGADDPFRNSGNTVLSAHRAGGIPQAFERIGDMVVDDLVSMAAGLPPTRMQVAEPELVGRYRNRPAEPEAQEEQ